MKHLLLVLVLFGNFQAVLADDHAPEHVLRLHQAIETRQATVEKAAQMEDLETKKEMEAVARQEFWRSVNGIYKAPKEVATTPVVVPVSQNSIEKALGVFLNLFR